MRRDRASVSPSCPACAPHKRDTPRRQWRHKGAAGARTVVLPGARRPLAPARKSAGPLHRPRTRRELPAIRCCCPRSWGDPDPRKNKRHSLRRATGRLAPVIARSFHGFRHRCNRGFPSSPTVRLPNTPDDGLDLSCRRCAVRPAVPIQKTNIAIMSVIAWFSHDGKSPSAAPQDRLGLLLRQRVRDADPGFASRVTSIADKRHGRCKAGAPDI